MRRLVFVSTAASLVLVLTGVVHSKKFTACPGGRFVVTPADSALLAGGTLTIGQGQANLNACGATSAKLVGGKKSTAVTARWAHCGTFTKVLLKGKMPSPACGSLQATIKAKKTPAKSFAGAVSTCGDGFLDGDGGEACDASASGGDAACPGVCNPPGAADACTCPAATTTTTVTASTTSTAPECTPTTTLPGSPKCASPSDTLCCGNGTVDPNETCDDGDTIDGNDCPANCFIAPCTVVAGTHRAVSVTYTPPPGQTVGGLGLFVDYPESQVRKPTIQAASGVSGVVHDRDYGFTEELIDATGIGLPTTLLHATFETCQCTPAPGAADFRCTVTDASDEFGNVIDPGTITCAVTIP